MCINRGLIKDSRKWCERIDSKLANGVRNTGICQSVDK